MIHLVVEKYRSGLDPNQQPKLITVTFNRYNKECLVSAIMEFLDHNFKMFEPPKYRDCEGDLVLLDSKEAFEVAVDDIQRTSHKILVVQLNGIYKYEFENNQRKGALTSSTEIREQIQFELRRQILHHPIIIKLQRDLAQIRSQIDRGIAGKGMNTAQDVAKHNSLLPLIQVPSTDGRAGLAVYDFVITEEHLERYVSGKGGWVLGSWKKLQTNFVDHVTESPFDVYKCRNAEIFCKQWTVRRISSKQWDNVILVNESIIGPLEIFSSKMETLYSKEQGQIVKFTVWMFYRSPFQYVYSKWRLIEITNCGQQIALNGDNLVFQAYLGSIRDVVGGNSNSKIDGSLVNGANLVEMENPDLRRGVDRTESGTVSDTVELEHLSYESVVASDYEVIDTGDIVAGN